MNVSAGSPHPRIAKTRGFLVLIRVVNGVLDVVGFVGLLFGKVEVKFPIPEVNFHRL